MLFIYVLGAMPAGLKESTQFHFVETLDAPKLDVVIIHKPCSKEQLLQSIEAIRQQCRHADIICLSAITEPHFIHTVFQLGIVDYIIAPYEEERLQQSLQTYREFIELMQQKEALSQVVIDRYRAGFQMAKSELPQPFILPKGIKESTLQKVLDYLRTKPRIITAEIVAEAVGLSRISARRYISFLEQNDILTLYNVYGAVGRPINYYRYK